MASFFSVGSQLDEVKLKDLLLHRYHTLDFDLEIMDFCELVMLAIEEENKAKKRQEWLALLPVMITMDKYKSFEEYYDLITGKNIDMRSTVDIIAEIDSVHERARKNKDGT